MFDDELYGITRNWGKDENLFFVMAFSSYFVYGNDLSELKDTVYHEATHARIYQRNKGCLEGDGHGEEFLCNLALISTIENMDFNMCGPVSLPDFSIIKTDNMLTKMLKIKNHLSKLKK
jgi:hypothetical protein